MKLICILIMIFLSFGALDACCCSLWFGYYGCGCNIFGCNCNYANDDYCYYTSMFPETDPGLVSLCWYDASKIIRSTERCSSVTLSDGVKSNVLPMNEPMMIYKTLDKNRDGFITSGEFGNSSRYLKRFMDFESINGMDTRDLFKSLDLNNNGYIEPTEIDDSLRGIKVPSNTDVKWRPNEENIFEFTSENLAEYIESPHRLSSPNHYAGLKLKAQVKVQSLSDHTLRAQMNHIQFYTSSGSVTLEAAHEILGADMFSLFGTSSHGMKEFKNDLEEPMMISLKRGFMKNMIVSEDEPTCVTTIKKYLCSELQKFNSNFGLKHVKKQPIVSVLPIPSRPRKVDLQI